MGTASALGALSMRKRQHSVLRNQGSVWSPGLPFDAQATGEMQACPQQPT